MTPRWCACPPRRKLINEKGAIVRMPVKGRDGLVEVKSRALPGKVSAVGTDVDPRGFDLIALAMQEPQYRSPGVRELLAAVAKSRVPCMSIYEHAAAAVPRVAFRAWTSAKVPRGVHRIPAVVGRFRSAPHDALQPRSPGLPPARRGGERPAGQAAPPTSRRRASTTSATRRCCASSPKASRRALRGGRRKGRGCR